MLLCYISLSDRNLFPFSGAGVWAAAAGAGPICEGSRTGASAAAQSSILIQILLAWSAGVEALTNFYPKFV